MVVSIRVQGAPNYYQCETGILDRLDELVQRYGFKKGIVIHGENSWSAAEPFFPKKTTISLDFYLYGGECSEDEIDRFTQKILSEEAGFVIGIGGGKVMDLAKASGNKARCDVVLIPTLAATCAPWTPLSVIYDDRAQFLYYTIFPRSTLMTLVEPRILLDSPVRYLRAGIGDTLAKWYEADALTRSLPNLSMPVQIAVYSAKTCQEILMEDSVQAVMDLEKGVLTDAIVRVIETNIMASGMVGGFGDHYGRVAGAHSIHNGMTQVRATHHLLHGEKVAYGILVQLALEKRFDEIERLLPLYENLKLPTKMEELGIPVAQREKAVEQIAESALQPIESIHFMDNLFRKLDVTNAIYALESRIGVKGGVK